MISSKNKKSRRQALLVVVLISVATLIFISYFVFGINKKPATQLVHETNSKVALENPPSKDLNRGLPVRLQIPKIKVDASVVYLGLTTDSDMAVPGSAEDVGWYKYGPLPGNKGSAVIDGHVVGSRGQNGVFIDLKKLQKGDNLLVIYGQGRTDSFLVRESRSYEPKADASEVFKSKDGLAHLNLITCEGSWSATQKSYSNRLVVFTDKQ